jgi:hypothetical protein
MIDAVGDVNADDARTDALGGLAHEGVHFLPTRARRVVARDLAR